MGLRLRTWKHTWSQCEYPGPSIGVGGGAAFANPLNLDDGVLRLEPALIGDLVQQGLQRLGLHFICVTTGRAQQVTTFVRMPRMIARQIGLGRFQSVHEADPHQEIEVPVNGERCDFALLPFLQQRD